MDAKTKTIERLLNQIKDLQRRLEKAEDGGQTDLSNAKIMISKNKWKKGAHHPDVTGKIHLPNGKSMRIALWKKFFEGSSDIQYSGQITEEITKDKNGNWTSHVPKPNKQVSYSFAQKNNPFRGANKQQVPPGWTQSNYDDSPF